jgi:hypothetical protein
MSPDSFVTYLPDRSAVAMSFYFPIAEVGAFFYQPVNFENPPNLRF